MFKKVLGGICCFFALGGIAALLSNTSTESPVVILFIVAFFCIAAILLFSSENRKKNREARVVQQKENLNTCTMNIPAKEASTQFATEVHLKHETKSTAPVLEVSIVQQKVPQNILNDMRINYTRQQAANDMRIIDESLAIMESTSDIDTFLSRYETAMRCAATLEQAREAGVPIVSSDNFSQSLVEAKNNALAGVLYRSFQKELDEISKLKTDKGKINRINKFQNKLEDMYADVFEFVAEDAYNDVIQKLKYLKNN